MVYPLRVFNGDVPELNICVHVMDEGPGQVDFVFYNQSTIKSSIASIYFDDDAALFSTVEAIVGAGTSFEGDASPGNLPGGRTLWPGFIAQFSFGADAPPPVNGINPGEHTLFRFGLSGSAGIDDVESALGNGMLRIGAHIIAMPDGSSVSAINVPLPATGIMFGLGSVMLRTFRRKTGNMVRPAKQVSYLDRGWKQ